MKNPYTFGHTDLAARRLRLLNEFFGPGSVSFLKSVSTGAGSRQVAVDLGCGPGMTTRMLANRFDAAQVVGFDASGEHVARARTAHPSLRFVTHDVTRTPFPEEGANADVMYARFLMAHLTKRPHVVKKWGTQLVPGGVLILEETARLTSSDPALHQYYRILEAMQLHHGQAMQVGYELAGLVRDAGLDVVVERIDEYDVTAQQMATLHHLNIQTWREDEFVRSNYAEQTLNRLEFELEARATGATTVGPLDATMARVVGVKRSN